MEETYERGSPNQPSSEARVARDDVFFARPFLYGAHDKREFIPSWIGATSDQEIQARVYEQASSGYYAPSADSIRRMVLSGTVRGSDARARLVGRETYISAGGRIERELFDDDDSESWVDVALLETLASEEMETLHLVRGRSTRSVTSQTALAGFHELLGPGVIQALRNPFAAAQLGNGVIAAQAVEHDPDLVLGREVPPGLAADILYDLLGRQFGP